MKFAKFEVKRFSCAISYIKDELKTGRHVIACLGSAGYTCNDDIERLAEYAKSIGDKEFADKIRPLQKTWQK